MKDANEPAIVNLGYFMGRIHQHIRKNAMHLAHEEGYPLKFEQTILLRVIFKKGDKIPQSQLLEALPSLDRHRLSRACAEMEELGLIHRGPNPENRRENILSLTPKGLEATLRFKELIYRANPHIFSGIPADEMDATINTLQKVLINLESKDPQNKWTKTSS